MYNHYVPDVSTDRNPNFYASIGKRAFDVVIIVLALPALFPILLLLTALSMLDGHSPIYVQERVGLHGKTFRMLKFRTMVVDADRRLEMYLSANPAARQEWDVKQKLMKDPRITRVGRFMRKSSMDELPQLLNVLRGEMSLIGPRPMMTDQVSLYSGDAYYLMRPGLSGLWQVSDRNQSSFQARVRFDEDYYENLSFKLDCQILGKTICTVVKGTGC